MLKFQNCHNDRLTDGHHVDVHFSQFKRQPRLSFGGGSQGAMPMSAQEVRVSMPLAYDTIYKELVNIL